MAESLTDLPHDVLLEILVRLPLKTLLVSKCVCRTFLDLTSPNAQFVKLHSTNAPQSLILQFVESFGPSRRIRLFEPEIQKFEFTPLFEILKLKTVNRFVLVNSCNGLLYFCVKGFRIEYSFLCNPVTNDIIWIRMADSVHLLCISQWLGFDSITNQFKVLRIFRAPSDESIVMMSHVLGLLSCSSSFIVNTPLGCDHSWDSSSTFVNGVIHWFDPSQDYIVSFDFEKEMFGEIPLPLEEQQGNKYCISIGVLKGCLALSCNHFLTNRLDIWVMEKHGNPDSWSKKLVVDTAALRRMSLGEHFKPLQILGNGELVMLLNKRDLVYYDPKNTSLRKVGLRRGVYREVVAFTPTFVKDAVRIHKGLCKSW